MRAHRIAAVVAATVALPASALTLGTALFSQFHIEPTAEAAFETRVGRPLFPPAWFAMGLSAIAALLLLTSLRRPRAWPQWLSAALSVVAVVVSLSATLDHRGRLDPRRELDKEMAALDLGPDATVVARLSRPVPDLPEVTWQYHLPLRRAETCARVRAALQAWADGGDLQPGTSVICQFSGHRAKGAFEVGAAPSGESREVGLGPDEAADAPTHDVFVRLYVRVR